MISPISISIPMLQSLKILSVRETPSSEELAQLRSFLQGCPQLHLEADEALIEKGKKHSKMYILLAGRLRVHLEREDAQPLVVLGEGETVGEISLIDQQPASAYVIADQPSQMLVLSLSEFIEMVRLAPQITVNLLHMMVERLRYGNLKITEGRERQRQYQKQLTCDALTSLNNRYWLNQELPLLLDEARKSRQPFALGMLDIDHFKAFNDQYGHPAGDRALQAVSATLSEHIREHDRVARYGGEEFTLLLPGATLSKAKRIAERLREYTAETSITDDNSDPLPHVTISIGLTMLTPDDTPQTLIERADQALYQAKHNGRNRVEVFED